MLGCKAGLNNTRKTKIFFSSYQIIIECKWKWTAKRNYRNCTNTWRWTIHVWMMSSLKRSGERLENPCNQRQMGTQHTRFCGI
jgi:hypothetical protein